MTARMVAFLAVGGAFAILGPAWPALKSKFSATIVRLLRPYCIRFQMVGHRSTISD